MRAISPNADGNVRGEILTLAEEQLDLMPITVLRKQFPGDRRPTLFSRWTFTSEERARIAAGEDITIAQIHAWTPLAVQLFRDTFTEVPPDAPS